MGKKPTDKPPLERTKIDSQGRAIPVSVIRPEMLKQDSVVNRTLDRVIRLHNRIKADKLKLYDEIQDYLDTSPSRVTLPGRVMPGSPALTVSTRSRSGSRNASSSDWNYNSLNRRSMSA